MKRIYNSNNLENAKNLRKNQTETELILWEKLRNRRFLNLKFLRQVPFGNYIADFMCQSKKLIIEIDGSQHIENQKYDEKRTKELEQMGYKVIRVYNNDVFNNLYSVLEYIYNEIQELELSSCICSSRFARAQLLSFSQRKKDKKFLSFFERGVRGESKLLN